MNQFSPMSQDNTPHPHQRFFDGDGNNSEQNAQEQSNNQNNQEGYPAPMPSNDNAGDMPPAMPQDDAPAPAPAPAPAADGGEYESYFNETRERLINVRKERNGIILRIDKLQDQRIENGAEDDLDDDSREISKLQSELWRKNNLIDALLKVLLSLK